MSLILAVEDEGPILSSIVDMLELDDYEVLTARNGLEGLRVLTDHQPDLIISDVMMPEMDGHEFFKAVREESRTANIPFMFLTALSTYDDIREGMNLGADDYIVKPFDYLALSTAVRTRLSKHQASELVRQRQFTRRVIDFQESERDRITEQIHSMIYEPIHALNLLLNVNHVSLNTLEHIGNLSHLLRENLQTLDEWLQPSMVSQLGLYPVLFWLIDQYRSKNHLDIDVQRAGYTPIFDHQEKILIYRVLDEILTNVVRHAAAKRVFIRLNAHDGMLEIDVEDNGVGFNVEYALQQSTLGLRMLDERVALLNGHINIHSVPRSGTNISVNIPYRDVELDDPQVIEQRPMSHAPSMESGKSSISVFLIDRQDIIRQGLTQIISYDSDIEIVGEAESAAQSIGQIGTVSPDVIVLDMSLADQSSFDLLRVIRERQYPVKVLCFGIHEQAVYVVESLRSGGDGYMLKSSPATEILKGIYAVAEGKQYICDALADEVLNWTLNTRNKLVQSAYDMLTDRERTIMLHVLEGATSAEIGDKLSISPRTVEKHRSNLMKKLNLKTPAQLLRFAIEHGIVER